MSPTLEVPDPFAEIEALITTRDEAAFWVRFFEAQRRAITADRCIWPTDKQLQRAVPDPDEREFLQILHAVAADPARRAIGACRIDLWALRMRLEWGLPIA